MNTLFYIASAVALISTVMVVTGRNPVHALLYLIVSLLAVAVVFYLLGAPFIAALEVIIYAGAIMVLFIFVIMMINLGTAAERQEAAWLGIRTWLGPVLLTLVLAAEFAYVFLSSGMETLSPGTVSPERVGISLFSEYVLAVELSAVLLLAGIIGAYHVGRSPKKTIHRFFREDGR
jgi:NADH-quinone oxidoreductase subunit J